MTDKQAEQLAIEILTSHHCKDVHNLNEEDIYSELDISGKNKEMTFAVEVKNREIDHDTYGDVFCSESKLRYFNDHPEYKSLLVFNFYTDGYFAVGNPKYGYKTYLKDVPKTTRFNGECEKGREMERVVSMKQLYIGRYK